MGEFCNTKIHARNGEFEFFVPDDVTLNNTIKTILLAEPLLFDSIVCVNTVNSVVTLSGYVDSMIEKDHLDKVVVELNKLVEVVNHVEVMPKLWHSESTGDTSYDDCP